MPNPGSPEATIEVDGLRKRFGPTVALDGMTFSCLLYTSPSPRD